MKNFRLWLAKVLIGKMSYIKNVDFKGGQINPRHETHFSLIDCNTEGVYFEFKTKEQADDMFEQVKDMGEGNKRV